MDNELVVLSKIEEIDKIKWSAFASNHINGNFFQTPEFYQVCENTPLYEPLIIIVIKESEILGLLLANIQKQFSGLFGKLTSRSVVLGGPLVKNNDPDILDIILKNYNKLIKEKAIYSQFRNMFDCQNMTEIFSNNGYKNEEHLNIQVDLTKTENELWDAVDKKAKNRIRAARKKGTKFIVEDNSSALSKCYDILKEVYSRINLPIVKFDYFLNLFNTLKLSLNKFLIFTVQYENEIIGCLLAIGFKETLYGLYNGASLKFYDKNPNDLIPWEIFLWAKDNGYKKFDWQGAGKPGVPYGVRDYKMKFGGELKNLGRFEKINKPIFFKMGKIGLKLYQSIKFK